jgi:hypothetical protein
MRGIRFWRRKQIPRHLLRRRPPPFSKGAIPSRKIAWTPASASPFAKGGLRGICFRRQKQIHHHLLRTRPPPFKRGLSPAARLPGNRFYLPLCKRGIEGDLLWRQKQIPRHLLRRRPPPFRKGAIPSRKIAWKPAFTSPFEKGGYPSRKIAWKPAFTSPFAKREIEGGLTRHSAVEERLLLATSRPAQDVPLQGIQVRVGFLGAGEDAVHRHRLHDLDDLADLLLRMHQQQLALVRRQRLACLQD